MFKKKISEDQSIHLTLEVSAKCNLNCVMCSLDKYYESKGLMSKKTFHEIIPYILRFNVIDFGYTGEPFLNKNIVYFIKKIKEINPNIYLQIITNGSLLSKNIMKELINHQVDEIMFSIDGATKQVYEKIRLGSDFNKVIKNIEILNGLKEKYFSKKPILTSTFVMMEQNYFEVPIFVDLMNEFNFERVTLNNAEPYSLEVYENSFYYKKPREMKKILREINIKSKQYSIQIIIPDFKSRKNKFCSYMYPLVSWDGDVIPCGTLSYNRPFFSFGKKKFYKKKSFGNIHKNSFDSIWNSKEYDLFRKNLKKGVFNEECKVCLRSFGIICGHKLLK